MKNLKQFKIKIFAVMMTFAMVFPFVTQPVLASKENVNNETISEQELEKATKKLADELELYFDKIGYLDENGYYIIKNVDLLKEQIAKGDKDDEQIYKIYLSRQDRSVKDGIVCVVSDQYGWIADLFTGDLLQALQDFIADKAWGKAADLIISVAAKALGTSAKTLSGIVSAASIALSIYNCRGEF